jgi:WD40 repeat protein/uncharacterized protein YjbI with pentapeptide repeats/3',5'-cyclic AMP phosphodiesterase CpdA/type II secretory pathway predicted ATPase ExeA
MSGVFVNYRVEDEAYAAALIDRELSAWFGSENVFRASRSIHPGDDYPGELLTGLRGCSVLLAVLGPNWSGAADEKGCRRITRGDDWVRREIAEAFERDIRVIPVLVADAVMPAEDDLPSDIGRLARCQYLRLHHRNVRHDIARLIEELTELAPDLAAVRAVDQARSAADRAGQPPPPGGEPEPLQNWTGRIVPFSRRSHSTSVTQDEPAVTVLHLSNTRFSRSGLTAQPNATPIEGRPRAAARALVDDLRRVRDDHGAEAQAVVVSGDVADLGLRSEYDQFLSFAAELCTGLELSADRVVVVPGNHDVNRRACSAYFDRCAADERDAEPPYVPKWDAFRQMMAALCQYQPSALLPPDQPWALFEIPELGLAVAALNSTLADSHRPEDHVGLLGGQQLAWFADRMRDLGRRGWLRLGVLHHEPRTDPDDGACLRDAEEFERELAPHLQLLLHGPSQCAQPRLLGPPGLPVLSAGSRGGRGAKLDQYQLIQIRRDKLRVWARRYDPGHRRWTADVERYGGGGTLYELQVALDQAHRVFSTSARTSWPSRAAPAGQGSPAKVISPEEDELLDRVAEVCRLQAGKTATVDVVLTANLAAPYLRVTSQHGSIIRQYPVGVCAGELTAEDLDVFLSKVDAPYRATDPGLQSVLVYGGDPASDELRGLSAARGVRLASFPEFQGVYDLRPYAKRQIDKLTRDPLYPPALYVTQRYAMVGSGDVEHESMLAALLRWLADPEGHFILVLGDFGLGKTFLLRELARLMHAEMGHVVPILIELRTLEKAHTLDEMIAAHLAAAGEQHIDLEKFRYLLRQGRVALLFDGFDELASRVTYDRAAEHLTTLLAAVEGRAKVVLTSRTQHFLSDQQVVTALGDRVTTASGRKLVKLQPFDDGQVLAFLTKLLGGEEQPARARFDLLLGVRDLLGLSRNPRMLGFVAGMDEQRLRYARERHGMITAGVLYRELLDQWLEHEYTRTQPSGAAPTLSNEERWSAVTELALRLWTSPEPTLAVEDLHDVAAALENLAARQLDAQRAAHVIGSGTLLVRIKDGRFSFAHQSVMEWLVARHASQQLRGGHAGPASLRRRPISPLMAEFLADLAGHDVAGRWAEAALADPDVDITAKGNALLVLARAGNRPSRARAQLAGRNLRGRDLTGARLARADLHGADLSDALLVGADLSGADLRDARLTGARLDRARLTGADLRGADLSDTRLLGADLRHARTQSSRWQRAALLGAQIDRHVLTGGDTTLAALPDTAIEPQLLPAAGRYLAVALDPAGDLLATGSSNGAVSLWSALTDRPLRTLPGHTHAVTAIAFSCDGGLLVTASVDGVVRLWDITRGRPRRVITSHLESVTAVAFNLDGTRLATACADGTLGLWNPESGEPVLISRDHETALTAVAFGPSGTTLAAASVDGNVSIRTSDTGQPLGMLQGHTAAVNAVAFTGDDAHLITVSADDTMYLWDRLNGQAFHIGNLGGEPAIALSPDGARLVSRGSDNTMHVWEPASGSMLTVLRPAGRVTTVAFSANGSRLAAATSDDTAQVWDLSTGRAAGTARCGRSRVAAITFTGDGRLASTHADNTTRLWDVSTGRALHRWPTPAGPLTAIGAPAGGGFVIATHRSNDDIVQLWHSDSRSTGRLQHGHRRRLTAIAFSPDGAQLATASTDHTTRLWNPTTGQHQGVLHGHLGAVTAAAFSSSGSHLATAGTDGTIRVWDTAIRQTLHILYRPEGPITTVAYSPDGGRLAAAATDGTTWLWVTLTGEPQQVAHARAGSVTAITFSPDGTRLAASSTDGTTKLWDAATGRALHELQDKSGWADTVAFSTDGRQLATGSTDGTIQLWDVEQGTWLATLIPLTDGWATLLPVLKYKLEGTAAGELWYTAGICRFEPGELDSYIPTLERLAADTPIHARVSLGVVYGGSAATGTP